MKSQRPILLTTLLLIVLLGLAPATFAQTKVVQVETIKVSAIRLAYRYAGFEPRIVVEIEVTKSTPFYPDMATNNSWYMRIGNVRLNASIERRHPNRLSATLTEDAFAQLKDGDVVSVNWGGIETKAVTTLDKSILQRAVTQGVHLTDVPPQIDKNLRYLFYLPGYIVHSQNARPVSPEYGAYEYDQILITFQDNDFVVISEARKQSREIEPYAQKVADQITKLLQAGVPAKHITVVGASQGSWIAMLASTYLKNRGVNFVLIAACSADKEFLKMVNLHGNILSIYEKSDLAQSCNDYRADATGIKNWKEVEVNTGLKHGFIYRPMKEWIEPTIAWAKR